MPIHTCSSCCNLRRGFSPKRWDLKGIRNRDYTAEHIPRIQAIGICHLDSSDLPSQRLRLQRATYRPRYIRRSKAPKTGLRSDSPPSPLVRESLFGQGKVEQPRPRARGVHLSNTDALAKVPHTTQHNTDRSGAPHLATRRASHPHAALEWDAAGPREAASSRARAQEVKEETVVNRLGDLVEEVVTVVHNSNEVKEKDV